MKISVIIPIYNVAPYVEQCLLSVMRQTYSDIEVLLVDDCGTDGSIKRCETFIECHQLSFRGWKILHHERNRGLSAARNTGIDVAKGEYVFFLDSDDTITADCISSLASSALKDKNIDLVVGDYVSSDGKQTPGQNKLKQGVYSEQLLHLYLSNQYIAPVWNKLVRLSFIKQHSLYFEEGLVHEDALWSMLVACRMRKLSVVNKQTYHYLIRESSLDHLPDKSIHEYHYAKVNALIGEYVSKDPILKKNIELYRWIEKDRYVRFLQPGWEQHIEVFQTIYAMFRQTSYWTFFDLLQMPKEVVTKGAWRRSLHKLLPYRYGYSWYVKAYNRFGV